MGDYHILMQFDIAAEREAVHRALSNPTEIAKWWSTHTGGEMSCPFGCRIEITGAVFPGSGLGRSDFLCKRP